MPLNNKGQWVVRKGDCLWNIAANKNVYGNGSKWPVIADANGIPRSNPVIYVGNVLKIPNISSSSGGGSSSTKPSGTTLKPSLNSTQVKVIWWALFTTDGSQADNRNMGIAWSYSRAHTDHYDVKWEQYRQGRWWVLSDWSSVNVKESTQSADAEATQIRCRVKPISKTYEKGGKTHYYWTNGKEVVKTYKFSNNPPEPISQSINLEMNKLTLRAYIDNINPIDINATDIEFEVYQNDTTKYLNTKAKIASVGNHVECVWVVDPGQKYKVRARAVRGNINGGWTELTENVLSIPSAPTNFRLGARDQEDQGGNVTHYVYCEWDKVISATGYTIEYTNNKDNFDVNPQAVQSVTIDNPDVTSYYIAPDSGNTWYFRIKATNEQGSSEFSDIESITIGLKPAVPTTWSNTVNAIVDEQIKLYWVHNSLDNSSETLAHLTVIVYDAAQPSAEPISKVITVRNERPVEDRNKTSVYIIDRDDPELDSVFTYVLQNGGKIKWYVQTKGVGSQESDPSIEREINVYLRPEVTVDIQNVYDVSVDEINSFPFYIYAEASPLAQIPVSYYVEIISNSSYDSANDMGKTKVINPGDIIYQKYYDPQGNNKHSFMLEMSPHNIDLEPNCNYTLRVTVAMDSGLTATSEMDFDVVWEEWFYDASATVELNKDTLEATIQPFCYEYLDDGEGGVTPSLVENCLVSVYRQNSDGTFTEIIKDVENSNNIHVLDPHPTLDYMRYRIVAKTSDTGSLTFNDIEPIEVKNPNVVIQWAEEWMPFIVLDEEYEPPKFAGSMLKIPYNVNVNDSNNKDVSLIEYVGREHPVSYYGTQMGTTSEWSVDIPKDDKETLYAIRRLMNYKGDVYVREPNGSGYWANINVNYSISHNEVIIPVSMSITRVEGGV